MGINARICPRCGREAGRTIGGLCPDCYVEVHGVGSLPEKAVFLYCKYCGSYKAQGRWNQPLGSLEETLREYLFTYYTRKLKPSPHIDEAWIERVEGPAGIGGPGVYKVKVLVGGRTGGITLEQEILSTLKVDVGVCPTCINRVTKRGYDAIIQIRSSKGKLTDKMREKIEGVILELDSRVRDSIISVEDVREGIDILVQDAASAKLIAARLKVKLLARVTETYKLVGRRSDGKRKGRLTLAVRVPELNPGDVVSVRGIPHIYLGQGRSGVLVVDMESGVERIISGDELWSGLMDRVSVDEKRLLLISSTKNSIVFLDAGTGYRDVFEVSPSLVKVLVGDFTEGREFKAYIHGSRVYVVEEVSRNG